MTLFSIFVSFQDFWPFFDIFKDIVCVKDTTSFEICQGLVVIRKVFETIYIENKKASRREAGRFFVFLYVSIQPGFLIIRLNSIET